MKAYTFTKWAICSYVDDSHNMRNHFKIFVIVQLAELFQHPFGKQILDLSSEQQLVLLNNFLGTEIQEKPMCSSVTQM